MTGLSDSERDGCKQMLSLMSYSDILLLSDTVTNKLIAVESITEAVEAILSYSKDAEELLKRKKVLRDIIFKYLAREGVVMPPNSDKHQLVQRTLEFWSSGKVQRTSQLSLDTSASSVSIEQIPANETSLSVRPTECVMTEGAALPTQVVGDPGLDPLVLGRQFCQWFFTLLNSQNSFQGQPPQDWGPQHFWEDMRLRLFSNTEGQNVEEFQGAEMASQRLLALARDESLLFSPNLESHGLRALSSPHGLVLVAVAGTIHRERACLGIYEQVFGLIRSPLENNIWKIKFINLKIRGQDALTGEEELASPALTCDSNELQLLCR